MTEVSIIVPCFNERNTIQLLLKACFDQTFPKENLEVIVADGMSEDGTRERIAEFQDAHPELRIRLIDNPLRSIPSGLNRAIEAANGEFLVRLDAHSIPFPDYVELCVNALREGLGDSVGGIWVIRPQNEGWQARAIAAAASHPFAVGDALYRFTTVAQEVDTLPFGAFHKSLIDKIGYFDESLLTNEDYEFNVRLRKSGGRIWLDPAIRSIYFARSDLSSLARQYWRYGFWKVRMLRRHPETIRLRQALPPLFVLSLLALLLLAIWFPLAGWIFVLESLIYAAILLLTGIISAWKLHDLFLIFALPLVIATMHLTWGSAFLWSLISK